MIPIDFLCIVIVCIWLVLWVPSRGLSLTRIVFISFIVIILESSSICLLGQCSDAVDSHLFPLSPFFFFSFLFNFLLFIFLITFSCLLWVLLSSNAIIFYLLRFFPLLHLMIIYLTTSITSQEQQSETISFCCEYRDLQKFFYPPISKYDDNSQKYYNIKFLIFDHF